MGQRPGIVPASGSAAGTAFLSPWTGNPIFRKPVQPDKIVDHYRVPGWNGHVQKILGTHQELFMFLGSRKITARLLIVKRDFNLLGQPEGRLQPFQGKVGLDTDPISR